MDQFRETYRVEGQEESELVERRKGDMNTKLLIWESPSVIIEPQFLSIIV